MQDKLLTSQQVEEILQVSRVTVYRMAREGALEKVKIGKMVRFKESSIKKILEKGCVF
ncbi:MAG: helix-turn-helix domain-containing protein [Firmicutes bacterium]|nr:helix-turn-helix domain-containing protein [Bacillota bacterium]